MLQSNSPANTEDSRNAKGAVLVRGVYVDLNAMKAGEVDSPEQARYTSVFQRLMAQSQPAEPEIAETLSTVQPREIPWLAVMAWTWVTGIVLLGSARTYHIYCFSRLLRADKTPASAVLAWQRQSASGCS